MRLSYWARKLFKTADDWVVRGSPKGGLSVKELPIVSFKFKSGFLLESSQDMSLRESS